MESSPVYSLRFTLTWIVVYLSILFVLTQLINFFLAAYLSLWILNFLIEFVERYIYSISRL